MPRLLSLAAALALATTLTASAGPSDAPRAVIQEMTDSALKVLDDQALDTETKRHRLESIVYAHLDFDTITRLVLARGLTRFAPAQRADFTQLFKEHLSLTYGRSIENYHNDRVEVGSQRQEPDGDVTVKSTILRSAGADNILVDYRLRQEGSAWMIIDIIIERVSLVSNFRSQFQELMSQGGPERVLAVLREKNAKREPLKTT